MQEQTPNINVVHSVWRRLKKAKIRDLQPVKDVKGGRGVAGKSEPTAGGTGITGITGKHRWQSEETRGRVWAASQRWIPEGEQSGSWTRIPATESVLLCELDIQLMAFEPWKKNPAAEAAELRCSSGLPNPCCKQDHRAGDETWCRLEIAAIHARSYV